MDIIKDTTGNQGSEWSWAQELLSLWSLGYSTPWHIDVFTTSEAVQTHSFRVFMEEVVYAGMIA